MCNYAGAGLALANIYAAEQEYAWNVDFQDEKYDFKKRQAAQNKKAAGQAAASKMLRAKLEAEAEKEKASEASLQVAIKQMVEESQVDAQAFAKGIKGQSVENTKRQLTAANLNELTKIEGDLEKLRVYLASTISDTTTEWKNNVTSIDLALEAAELEKKEAIGDYNMVRAGHLLSKFQGYITDKQLGDDWKVDEWFKGKPSPTPQQDAMERRWDVPKQKSKTQIRMQSNTGWQDRPMPKSQPKSKLKGSYKYKWWWQ